MKSKLIKTLFIQLAFCFLFSACDSNHTTIEDAKEKISIEQAKKLILATPDLSQSSIPDIELIEITPSAIWDQTNCQLYKIVDDVKNSETFIVVNQKAVHIGNGFGGFGLTSAVPYDVNKDGFRDIVYAYSWGSGIHRSVISWIDIKSFTEHPIEDRPDRAISRADALILKIENNEVVVYRIAGMDESEINPVRLRLYPSNKDIENMTLEKEGTLVWKNNEFYNHLYQE
ncbi:hypothetical protein [Paenibacillus sp. BC26]|uniref:hypothetical protein n=1 Tax=Paenibacillus sp. BC26 TaxID=1881032 RepID=UPI0008E1850E|nr:hypothetical protein [Paenibacillus sp. BC26]SFS66919.1 hypothetical protein SAMN05428962_2026 [Paenibacillus sp. BC26]